MKKLGKMFLNFSKKFIVLVLFMLSLCGSLASFMYLVVNVQEIPLKISQGRVSVNDTSSTKSESQQNVPLADSMEVEKNSSSVLNIKRADVIEFLRKWSVDLSAVTPLLLLWFFVSLTVYSGRLIWLYVFARSSDDQNRRMKLEAWTFDRVTNCWYPPFLRTDTDVFPFYRHYDTIFVQAGFIGTIWGFLIVGWNMGLTNGESAKGLDIVDTLMRAFGTALVSTFTAVVLVYAVSPVLQSIFRWVIGFADELTPEEQMERFNDSVAQTIAGISTFGMEVGSLTTVFGDINALISKTLENAVREAINTLDKQNAPTQKAILKVLQELKEQQGKKQDTIITHIEYMSRKLDELTSQVQKSAEVLPEKLEKVHDAIEQQTHVIQEKSDDLSISLQQNHQILQNNHSYLQRFVSYFSGIFKGFEEQSKEGQTR